MSSPHLDGTLGAVEIAAMVTSALYGVTTTQTYLYFQRSVADPITMQLIVALLWILDTLHQLFICHTVYTYTITDYGDPLAATRETWSLLGILVISPLMDIIVRSVLCYRIWKFSGHNCYLATFIMLFSLGDFASTLVFAIRSEVKLHGRVFALHSSEPEFWTGTVFSIVADLAIACSQVTLLWRSRTFCPSTDSLLRTLMLYSINTGVVTALCAVLLCIMWASMPRNLVYQIFYAAQTTLLLNALLATLNARHDLRQSFSGRAGLIQMQFSAGMPDSSTMTNAQTEHLGEEIVAMTHLVLNAKDFC